MSDLRDEFSKEVEVLKKTRDELRVQLHLAKVEAKEEWEKLESKWHHVEADLKHRTDESKKSIQEASSSVKEVARELKEGYEYIRSLMQ